MSAEDVLRNATSGMDDPELRAMIEKAKRMDAPEVTQETIFHKHTSSLQLQPVFPGSEIMLTVLSFVTPGGSLMHFPMPAETWDSLVRIEMSARSYYDKSLDGRPPKP